jgi:hypothetical protein
MPGRPQKDGIVAEVYLLEYRHQDPLLGTEINVLKSGRDPEAQDELKNPPPGG